MHLGRARVIGCWQVGDVLVDPGPESCLPTLLEALGDDRPRALLLTHIHLDHAGASGALVKRWPDLEIYVHERGAPHLIAPARLMESARRLYGDDMDRLWGDMAPVPEASITVLKGGESVLDGAFEVAYTPGHASHHVSYLHDGTAFVGDVGGVRVNDDSLTIPPTPPPDIDVEAWHRSIELIAQWRPQRLAMTHFGLSEDVDTQLAEVGARLDDWAKRVGEMDADTFVASMLEEVTQGASDPELLPTYTQAAPPEQMYAGLERYLRKRAESASKSRVS
ncbi:MAG TPA: MBL fold metallo-hydrolase [Solirubrobacteraceae bacterium]|jgi:glyoxylase-like metal-dependent hydrolase (beta-lactamase superfamily II)